MSFSISGGHFSAAVIFHLKNFSDDNCNSGQVATVVGAEPGMAAKLLQMANSAALNPMGSKITELKAAIARIGFSNVRTASLAYAMEQIRKAVEVAGEENLGLMHSTSAYPCEPDELNLRMVETLSREFPNIPIGYSGHEVGLVPSAVAVALGACMVERHLTLDRAMWGSDQAASVEPGGFRKLVKYIRVTEQALGDGVKKVYDSERSIMKKLRRVGGND